MIASRQYGVVARRQLRAAGVAATTVDSLVRRRGLFPLHRGVYAVGDEAVAEVAIKRLVERAGLEAIIARSNGRRGTSLLAAALDDLEPARSVLERGFVALIRAHDLPMPVLNARVNGYEVDAYWPQHRLVVEIDGFAFHTSRHAFEADRERDAELQAAGLHVIRHTSRQLRRTPDRAAARLRRALARLG